MALEGHSEGALRGHHSSGAPARCQTACAHAAGTACNSLALHATVGTTYNSWHRMQQLGTACNSWHCMQQLAPHATAGTACNSWHHIQQLAPHATPWHCMQQLAPHTIAGTAWCALPGRPPQCQVHSHDGTQALCNPLCRQKGSQEQRSGWPPDSSSLPGLCPIHYNVLGLATPLAPCALR
eukprot:366012-Chlamydomonas_euryale.AAC.20